jgi:hypothetical protein
MSNGPETRKTAVFTLTLTFEGDYVPAGDIPQYVDQWVRGSLNDREDLREVNLHHITTVEVPVDDRATLLADRDRFDGKVRELERTAAHLDRLASRNARARERAMANNEELFQQLKAAQDLNEQYAATAIENGEQADKASDATYSLWCWIINANKGGSKDVDDLISILDTAGMPCPEGLREDA